MSTLSPPPLLEWANVSMRFASRRGVGAPAVDQVSLAVRPGETLGLVGESGCGKSTLARMAVRLLRPSSGQVLLKGRSLWDRDPDLRRDLPSLVQMVFQDPFSSLNPRRSVAASVREPLDIRRMGTRAWRKQRVRELLEQVGVAPSQGDRFPHQFSGGQRQRVAIARALALNPQLLVCDEPVSALDVSIQAQILNLLLDIQESLNLTYLFISHDLAVVGHVSDRIAVMLRGRIVEVAPSRDLLSEPRHPYSRLLLESAARVSRSDARQGAGKPETGAASDPGLDGGCPFRPSCVRAADQGKLCALEAPALREWAPGRFAACHGADR